MQYFHVIISTNLPFCCTLHLAVCGFVLNISQTNLQIVTACTLINFALTLWTDEAKPITVSKLDNALHLAGTLLTVEVSSRQVGSHRDLVLIHDHPAVLQQGEPGEAHWEKRQRQRQRQSAGSLMLQDGRRKYVKVKKKKMLCSFAVFYLVSQPGLSFWCWPCCCYHSWHDRRWRADGVSRGAELAAQSYTTGKRARVTIQSLIYEYWFMHMTGTHYWVLWCWA